MYNLKNVYLIYSGYVMEDGKKLRLHVFKFFPEWEDKSRNGVYELDRGKKAIR